MSLISYLPSGVDGLWSLYVFDTQDSLVDEGMEMTVDRDSTNS